MSVRVSPRAAREPGGRRARLSSYLEIGASGIFLVVVVLVGLISFLYLLQVGGVATTGYQIRDLEQRKAELLRENQRLSYEKARLQSLGPIEAAAATRLGMKRSGQPQFLALQDVSPVEATGSTMQQTTLEARDVYVSSDQGLKHFLSRLGVLAETGLAKTTREKP